MSYEHCHKINNLNSLKFLTAQSHDAMQCQLDQASKITSTIYDNLNNVEQLS